MDDQIFRQGRRRLRGWLPAARAAASGSDELVIKQISALAEVMLPYVTEDNLDALLIHPAPLGGWHGDLVLKNVPRGVPNTAGSPAGEPFKTREEAERFARRLLQVALVHVKMNRGRPAPQRDGAFLLYDWSFRIVTSLLDRAVVEAPEWANGYESQARAMERIEEELAKLGPGEFDGEVFNRLPVEKKSPLVVVLHIATLNGVFAYPPRVDASPSHHTRTSDARH